MPTDPTVFVVDGDAAVRKLVRRLAESACLPVRTYAGARDFLDDLDPQSPGCIVVDVGIPVMSGLELQDALRERGVLLPILFLTGCGDVAVAVQAMKAGAFDVIEKPFQAEALLDRIHQAIAHDTRVRRLQAERQSYLSRCGQLTRREQQVMNLLVGGLLVKEVAVQLGLSHKTVQVHRAHIMKKMCANSIAELVRLATAFNGVHADFQDLAAHATGTAQRELHLSGC